MSVRRRVAVIVVALAIIATAGILYIKPEALNRTEPLIPNTYRTINGAYSVTYDFISATHGWALVSTYLGDSSTFFIFKTTNAAEVWRKQFSGTPGHGDARSLHFFDDKNGFLYGIDTYRTVDGGDHWELVPSPGPSAQVWFCSPLEGWAEMFDPDGMHIYRTVDGGVSWHRTSSDPPAAALFDPAPAFRIGGEAWFAAESQPGATLFVTRDGGASWNTILLIPPYCCGPGSERTAYATSVRIVGDTSLVAFIANERFGIPQTMVSGDDGLSWTTADLPVDGVAPDEVTLLDTDHWWVFNSNAVYLTDDGGRSWIYARDFDFGTNWRPGKAVGIDATHAWRSLTSTANSQVAALAMTADGGSHWRLVNAPQP